MMDIIIYTLTGLFIFLAVLTSYFYLTHPLAGTRLASYTGGIWWKLSLLMFIVIYFKGS